MQLHFQNYNSWRVGNERLIKELDLNADRLKISWFKGVSHAVIETCLGLAKLFPIKKNIYYFKNQSLYFDSAIIQLAREGYKIVPLDLEILNDPTAWVNQIQREDLFLLYAVDDSFLGQKYAFEKMEAALTEKSLAHIRVSHARHFYEPVSFNQIPKNMSAIFSFMDQLAFGVFGERNRIGTICADRFDYEDHLATPLASEQILTLKSPITLSAQAIIDFENERVANSTPYFSSNDSRIFDRAVIFWTDMEGSAFIEALAQELDLKNTRGYLETPSHFKWENSALIKHLDSNANSAEKIRGMVIISHKLLENGSKLRAAMIRARELVLKAQNGG